MAPGSCARAAVAAALTLASIVVNTGRSQDRAAGPATQAARPAAAPLIVPLWPGEPPGMIKDAGEEVVTARGGVTNVSVPAVAVHLPEKANASGLALIVCPGGSYREVGLFATGMGAVERFVPQGVAVIVLKYRTRPPSPDVQADALADAKRAVRLVRHHAADWNIDPARIGMLGSSAGSHLILNLATHSDRGNAQAEDPVERQACRPDFVAMLCPWPGKQSIDAFPIDAMMPPTFICSALDDRVAPTAFASEIAEACRAAGVQAELWTVPAGGHTAFSPGRRGEGSRWAERFWDWLAQVGMRQPQQQG